MGSQIRGVTIPEGTGSVVSPHGIEGLTRDTDSNFRLPRNPPFQCPSSQAIVGDCLVPEGHSADMGHGGGGERND